MGEGAAGSFEPLFCLMVSKILACFTRAKLLKISAFLLSAVCAATALLDNGIAPVVRKYSGNTKRSSPPSSRISATSVYEEVSDEKTTALGTGFFLTWVLTYTDQHGEVLGRQRFRVLRFKPAR